jgi:hypothetical protein
VSVGDVIAADFFGVAVGALVVGFAWWYLS